MAIIAASAGREAFRCQRVQLFVQGLACVPQGTWHSARWQQLLPQHVNAPGGSFSLFGHNHFTDAVSRSQFDGCSWSPRWHGHKSSCFGRF
jgi:hypothetical protein